MTRGAGTRRWLAGLAVVSAVLLYAPTLGYGLYWDDFSVLRPWSLRDVAAAFSGPYRPWDPSILFYRPLTSVYYAVISTIWGWHATPLHLIAMASLALLGVMTTRFVLRDTHNVAMAGIAAVLVAVHPTLATSMGPWIANQYHTFMILCLIAALFAWQSGRQEPRSWWWRATPWLIAAAWFKEDGLLLPLAIISAQWLRATIARDVPRPARIAWVALLALTLGLIAWRSLWLPSPFGYGLRTPEQTIANLLRAPRYVLLWQVGPGAVAIPAMLAKAAILAATTWVLARARGSAGAGLILTGLTVMFFANLPLAMVSSEGRWHLVGWGAVLMASGALGEWVARAPRWGWPATAMIVAALSASAMERVATFAPCSDESVVHDREMAAEAGLPPELRAWLRRRESACRAGQYEPFTLPMRDLTWGPR